MKKKFTTGSNPEDKLSLQLFVAGMSENSMAAIQNIKEICNNHLEDCFELDIIDIYKNPKAVHDNQIVFSPSLIKHFPLPKKILIGTFSDIDKVLKALGIKG